MVALAPLQGRFVNDRRDLTRWEDTLDALCSTRAASLVGALQAEALAAEDLQVFQTMSMLGADVTAVASSGTSAYRQARVQYTLPCPSPIPRMRTSSRIGLPQLKG